MCKHCRGFNEPEKILSIWRFRDITNQLDDLLRQLVFVLIEGREEWESLMSGGTRPDVVFFKFECIYCRSIFQLFANFYHGGAQWSLLKDLPESSNPVI